MKALQFSLQWYLNVALATAGLPESLGINGTYAESVSDCSNNHNDSYDIIINNSNSNETLHYSPKTHVHTTI